MIRTTRNIALAAIVATAAVMPGTALSDGHMETEVGPLIETFGCQLKGDATYEDVFGAAEYFNEQIDRMDGDALDSYFAAILTPVISGYEPDFVWLGAWPNLRAWAAADEAMDGTEEARNVGMRFDEIVDCRSTAWLSENLHDGMDRTPTVGGPTSAIEVFTCQLRDDHRLEDLSGADAYYSGVLAEMEASTDVYRYTPAWGNSDSDVVYFVVHESMSSMADVSSRIANSEHADMIDGWYSELLDCDSGVFKGRPVRVPAN